MGGSEEPPVESYYPDEPGFRSMTKVSKIGVFVNKTLYRVPESSVADSSAEGVKRANGERISNKR